MLNAIREALTQYSTVITSLTCAGLVRVKITWVVLRLFWVGGTTVVEFLSQM